MKINQNISAVIVNDQLLRNENSLSESVKKLSSGFKFNSARDNPSGVAITYKMQSQIKALERASTNATDGTSMVQTIDGSMGEMMEVLQRTRELCVQAANDTNGPEDRAAIQEEIAALKEEVDRISSDTEYNGMNLLDGNLDRRTYVTAEFNMGTPSVPTKVSMFDKVSNVIISDSVQARDYKVNVTGAPTKATVASVNTFPPTGTPISVKGSVYINGAEAKITEDMTAEEAFEAIRDAAETGWVDVEVNNGNLVFEAEKYGSEGKIEISCSSTDLAVALGLDNMPTPTKGNDVQVKIVDPNSASGAEYEGYSGQATARTSGNHVVITDKSGFEISFEVTEDILKDPSNADLNSLELTIEATDMGILRLQVGANEDQELAVRVPVLNTRSMYIDDLDVTKIKGANRGMDQMDKAIEILSAARSKMGAYENSLDYTERSLDQTIEDMTNAISRLADVDMAQEMTTYTNASVLTQASISVLAQANDLPQQVLSLLQG